MLGTQKPISLSILMNFRQCIDVTVGLPLLFVHCLFLRFLICWSSTFSLLAMLHGLLDLVVCGLHLISMKSRLSTLRLLLLHCNRTLSFMVCLALDVCVSLQVYWSRRLHLVFNLCCLFIIFISCVVFDGHMSITAVLATSYPNSLFAVFLLSLSKSYIVALAV